MPDGARPAGSPGRTYLVIGSDSRADLTGEQRKRLGTGQVAGVRHRHDHAAAGAWVGAADRLVSVPRDSYVEIPGHGKNKINAAFALGGPQAARPHGRAGDRPDGSTSGDDRARRVRRRGRRRRRGPVVPASRPIKDEKAHIDIPAGCQPMDGATALGYARARYSDPRGDLGRVERQREVLAAIAGKDALAVGDRPRAVAGGPRRVRRRQGAGRRRRLDAVERGPFVLAMRAVSGGGGLSLTVPIGDANIAPRPVRRSSWDTAKSNRLFRR